MRSSSPSLCGGAPCSRYIDGVLRALLPRHAYLRVLEGRLIRPDRRLRVCAPWQWQRLVVLQLPASHACPLYQIWAALKKWKAPALEEARLNLAMVTSAVPVAERSYLPQDALPGAQYQPDRVSRLLWLQALRRTSFPSFEPFHQLQQLNIASNRLTTLDGMGLQTLAHLQVRGRGRECL